MKNWINKMNKEKLQRFLFIGVLILVFGVFFLSLNFIEPNPGPGDDPNDNPNDPQNPGDQDPLPTFETIQAPLKLSDYQVIRKFWSLSAPEEDQLVSIIKFESKYFTSKGLSYSNGGEEFEVVASLSGQVISVTDSPVNGKVVAIKVNDYVVTEYMSLGTVTVEVGQNVAQGAVIGTSGNNEFDRAAENHVHFRIAINGVYKDPEKLIGKKLNQIE